MMRRVTFVRHGESTGVESGYHVNGYDQTSVPLSAVGKIDAETFAKEYKGTPSLIVTSPFVRSRETAAFLAKRFPDVPVEEWNDVREFDYMGAYITPEERRIPKRDYWEKADPDFKFDQEHENFSEFFERVQNVLQRVRHLETSETVIFSHAKFMRLLSLCLVHGAYEDHSAAMRDLSQYPYRVSPCGSLALAIDGGRIFLCETINKTDEAGGGQL